MGERSTTGLALNTDVDPQLKFTDLIFGFSVIDLVSTDLVFFGHWSDFTAFVNFNWLLEAGCMVVIQVLQPIKASEAKGFQIRKSQTALI